MTDHFPPEWVITLDWNTHPGAALVRMNLVFRRDRLNRLLLS